MQTTPWRDLLLRIVPDEADDLDALTGPFDPRRDPVGQDLLPEIEADLLPQAALKRSDAVCIGVRVTTAQTDAADRALRIASFAAERDVEIVVLSHVDSPGLERFGFRIERVAGATAEARARCEAQICRFWNIDLVL